MANADSSRDQNDFAITINFKPGESDPTRVFKTAIALIGEFSSFDRELAKGIDARLVPTLLLEGIEDGSVKIWLRTALRAIDDDALKSGDWKKVVGHFLFQAKYKLLEYLEKEGDAITADSLGIEVIRNELEAEARTLELGTIPTPAIPPRSFFILQMVQISAAVGQLTKGESVDVEGPKGEKVRVSPSMQLSSEDIERLSVASTPTYDSEVVMPIKKPDFIGDSRWEFILLNHAIEAKMLDLEWLNDFRQKRVPLLPGSQLNVTLRQTISMGFEQEHIAMKYFVVKVHGVVDPPDTRGFQLKLPS